MKIRKPHPATILATLALLLATAGTATAGKLIVTSKHVANNSLRSEDIRNNTLRSIDVMDGTLRARDFRASELASLRGPAGVQGPQGETGAQGLQGPAGPAGPQGAPGLSGIEVVNVDSGYSSTSPKTLTASCPGGKVAIAGGYAFDDLNDPVRVNESRRTDAGTGWLIAAREFEATDGGWGITAYAVCATVA